MPKPPYGRMTSHRIVLGTASVGITGRDAGYQLLDEFVRLGGTTLDSASVYSDWVPGETGRSENTIGDWLALRGNRDAVTIVTKGAHPFIGETASRLDPASIRHDVELSLKRLRTDRIDQWLLHKDDGVSPVAEIVETLQTLHKEGKILSFGCSNWKVPRIEQALAIPGVTFTGNQVLGNVFAPIMGTPSDATNEVIDASMFAQARHNGMTLYLFTSTARGFFEKRSKGVGPTPAFDNPAVAAAAPKLEAIAAEQGLKPSVMILAFLMHLGPNVRPVIGPNTVEQLQAAWAAADVSLSSGVVRRIAHTTGMTDFLTA
ncbi:MAG: aldo/keto reductase [Vicinamibacterales bacterium]